MDIILGWGFDQIRFGMKEADIVAILGSPDKKYESDYDLHLVYFSIKCDLWILKEDNRLHWIQSSNPKAQVFGKLLINENKKELISFLNSKLDDKLEIDDFGWNEYYTFTDTWLSLYFEFNVLTMFSFGHFWSDNDEPVWQIDD
ncbi:MAG: hypothetical protein AAFO95_16080 [Cyanobacteria bacterium J06600_6]